VCDRYRTPNPNPNPTPNLSGVEEFPSQVGSTFSEGIVSAAHPLAAEAGAQVLEAGGNAIDAAVVTQFVLNVVEPTSSGIGGGGFMGIYKADENRVFYIDSREKAPATATPTMFLACDPNCTGEETETIGSFTERATSGIGVGVPGTLLGARTFQLIADNGVDVFYTGEIGDAIVEAQLRSRAEVGEQGAGRMSRADLAAYLADFNDGGIDEREPIVTDYRGYTINGMPPPSSGGLTVGQIRECVEQFPMGDVEAGFGPGALNTLHVMAESMRLAFSSRSRWMGDNDNLALPIDGLLNPGYLLERCDLITVDARIADDAVVPGDPRDFDSAFAVQNDAQITNGPEGQVGIDTTHFTVIDAAGNVVSWTSTIEGTWGSGITVPGYGFLLNNELTDFNSVPQATDTAELFAPGANDVAPFKRPRVRTLVVRVQWWDCRERSKSALKSVLV